ncbi:MAG: DMT family transporter [Halopseudomonas aestusnigri]
MIRVYMSLALAMAMVGGNIAVGKSIVEEVPLFVFMVVRGIVAVGVLYPWMRLVSKETLPSDKVVWRELFLQSFLGIFLFSVFMLLGVGYTTAVSAGIITSTIPAVVAVLSWFILKERMSAMTSLAIALAVGGVALTNLANADDSGSTALLGGALVMLAVVMEALFTIFAKRLSNRLSPVQLATGVNVVSLLLFLPFGIWQSLETDLSLITTEMWLMMGYYSLTASVLSFYFWYWGVARVSASTAGLFTAVMPVSAALAGILFLSETFSLMQAIGMGAVLAAIAVGTMGTKQSKTVSA